MPTLGLEDRVVDRRTYDRTVEHLRRRQIVLPTFAELADPTRIPAAVTETLAAIDPDEAHPLNLFRIHWYNDATRSGRAPVPEHVVLPKRRGSHHTA